MHPQKAVKRVVFLYLEKRDAYFFICLWSVML